MYTVVGAPRERFLQQYCRGGTINSHSDSHTNVGIFQVETDSSSTGNTDHDAAHPSSIAVIILFSIIGLGILTYLCKYYNRKRKEVKQERYSRLLAYANKNLGEYIQQHPLLRQLHSAQTRGITQAPPHQQAPCAPQESTVNPGSLYPGDLSQL